MGGGIKGTDIGLSKQASIFICPINKHKDIITYKGRLPAEKPIRPNIAGRLAKKKEKSS